MTIYVWGAIAVVILTLAALIRRYDTKLVLLIAGLAMCCLSMNPMAAFQQFDKSMTNSALIISICSSMGFAACVTMTKCDLHLVSLLTKPLNKLGILLLPCCMIVTGIASVAIGSLAGLCAAIGPTTLILSALSIVFVMIVCLLFKDYRKEGFGSTGVHPGEDIQKKLPDLPEKPNLLMAFAPLLPVVLLFVISLCFPGVKMSVATAMLMGLIYVMIVTRLNPQQLCSKFFDGMGSGYGSILGLIIAAGVFAAGLKSCGLISLFIDYLKNSSDVAKLGASFGPYLLGIITGSGNAAAFAFNESVTPHALEFGMKIEDLGFIACVSATLGRVSSPLAAGVILIAGIAGASPLDVVKRSIPVMLCTIGALYFLV